MQKPDFRERFVEEEYVDLLSDAGFKAVFCDEDNKDLVIMFINRMLSGERNEGDHDYFCPPVYLIGIMQGHLQHEDAGASKSCISRYRMENDNPKVIAPATISCIFVQLGFFDKAKEDCVDLVDQWCYCLKHARQMRSLPESFSNLEISTLRQASELALFGRDKRQFYLESKMTQLDINHESYFTGKDDGRIEGKIEGRLEGKQEAAKNFLNCGIDIDIIAKCTGLDIEQIKSL